MNLRVRSSWAEDNQKTDIQANNFQLTPSPLPMLNSLCFLV
jgi:hypothetical protein